jgi:DNA-binding transcriptional ArsR family regulator
VTDVAGGRGTENRQMTMRDAFVEEVHRLHAELCQALADPKRILILYALAEAPRTVGELADGLSLRQSNVSQHLAVLRDRGLVTAERAGTRVTYSIAYPAVIQALDLLRAVLREKLEDTSRRAGALMEIA